MTERKLAAILSADAVGYTSLMAEVEEKGLRSSVAPPAQRAVAG